MTVIVARAPTRIDFGGGWTDVPPYCDREGGFVCNVAISRYATVRLEPHGTGLGDVDEGRELALAEAALRVAGMPDVHPQVSSDFPVGAGLGGSSAAGVAMMGALEAFRAVRADGLVANHGRRERDEVPRDRAALAEASRRVEVEELHVAGGFQDHYAAAFGGALALTFGNGTQVRRLALSQRTRLDLESRCIVAYTGQSRISGDTIRAVLDAYRAGDPGVVHALARMQALSRQMADALEAEDVGALGALVREHWTHQRALHPSITTPRIDQILAAATAAGAVGGKALGASGGGCVVVIAAPGLERPVRRAVEALATTLPFTIDLQGFTWWIDDRASADAALPHAARTPRTPPSPSAPSDPS